MNAFTYGSLFSGCGGFDLGLDAAGMRGAFQCEIDKNARAVLRHRWPEVPKHDDVRALTGGALPRVDLLVGGFPCQDVSVAGNRAGLAGDRTGLFFEFVRLVRELAPEWLLLENVPGLLSSNGWRDMGTVLWTLGELGYGWAYRSLDARYDGVAQRRERVFIVGRAGGRSPVEVLFEPESLRGNPPPRRQAREDVAGTLGGCSPGGGWSTDTDRMTFVAAQCHGSNVGPMGALRTGHNEGGGVPFLSSCVTAREGKGPDSDATTTLIAHPLRAQAQASHRADSDTYVAHTLRAGGFDASEDGTGRGTPLVPVRASGAHGSNGAGIGRDGDPAFTLDSTGSMAVIGFNARQDPDSWRDRTGPLDTDGTTQAIAFDLAQITSPTHWANPQPGGAAGTLNGSARSAVASPLMGVRRLTPRECERLQGYPDDHTRYGVTDKGKRVEMADGPRYRMCGNGVAAPVARWIASRILAEARRDHQEAA